MKNNLVQLPRLSRTGAPPKRGIVHLGPGAFCRAFNAVYTHDAMEAEGGDWGIVAVSLRSSKVYDQLEPQDGVYTSVEMAPDGNQARLIGSICEVLVAPDKTQAVLSAMSEPNVRIVSLTITEKGYCHDPRSGGLKLDHPDIVHDLSNLKTPVTAIGYIVEALAQRRAATIPPFTILSCDNLPSNGSIIRQVVLDFAHQRSKDLADWIEKQVDFPATMVDRITPATTDLDIEKLANDQGYYDPACVIHEPFSQWVIENKFTNGHPAWDRVGAQMVQDVDAHETMKLRCLNGTHSILAYLGYLAGFETIAQTVADPRFENLCHRLWNDEILPTLEQPEDEDLSAYTASLLKRYKNTAIQHRTWQIAMDGSQKLPQRLLGTVRDNLAKGIVPHGLCLGIAAWMRYVGGIDETGAPIDVRDPLAQRLLNASTSASDAAERVTALLKFPDIFGEDLPGNLTFYETVASAYKSLEMDGAKKTVQEFIEQTL